MKIITLVRTYKQKCTLGEVYLENNRVAYSLEDPRSPSGMKLPGITCIPEGAYIAKVTKSPRFGKELILLCSEGKDAIIRDGVTFVGVRVHGGNVVEDTEGCPLVGECTNHEDRIWSCAKVNQMLIEYVKANQPCLWVITSK